MIFKRFDIRIFLFLIVIFSNLETKGQSYLEREDIWVRQKISSMTLDQKIGQLFIVRAYSKGNIAEEKIISDYITKYHIGGLCFFQGSPVEQANLINQ